MKELDIATNLFTNHIYFWGDLHYSTFAGPDRARSMDPAGSAQRMGIPFSLHSDASVTPVDPLFSMWTASARKTLSGRVLGEGERISVPASVARSDARSGLPSWTGRQEGLDPIRQARGFHYSRPQSVLTVSSPDELKDIKVLGTVMGGKPFSAGAGR